MKYVDFVERVLTAVAEAEADLGTAHAALVPTHQVGLRMVPEGTVDEATYSSSGLQEAMIHAVDDLEHMGLVRTSSAHFVGLEPRGRQVLKVGLRSQWPGIMQMVTLTDDAMDLLTVAAELAEAQSDHWSGMRLVKSDELIRGAGKEWSHPWLVQALGELKSSSCADGLTTFAYVGVRPTYVGMVVATERAETELQLLVRSLLPEWETTSVEFKEQVLLGTNDRNAEFTRDIAALVNTKASGRRYLVIGFDNKTHTFKASVDPRLTKDRMEDVLGSRLAPVPDLRFDTCSWEGGTIGVIEVVRDPARLPHRITGQIRRDIPDQTVFVRHGSHVAQADPEEVDELIAEAARAQGESR